MSLHRTSRKYHKWLMLFVGLQLLTWSITGTYMVLMDIDYIHGDTLVAKKQKTLTAEQVEYSFKELLEVHPQATAIELGFMLKKAVYRFNVDKKKVLVSAFDGQQLSPINEPLAISIAKELYNDKSVTIAKVELLTDNSPGELSGRHLPVWRIDFDDFASPSFYISANSGQLVTKRHNFWRLFDWMFVFHVMDYTDGEADNKLLLLFTVFAFIASIFGLVLTYYRLAPQHRPSKRSASKNKPSRRKLKDDKAEATNEKN
ncbi:PepSY domain-containing protein [Colwellia sp. 75C3]|uniref:PepSY domain-containing protein n=1 Tax=Colwellia sp. 75C3 TaxID=888425 RepID=UPI001E2B44C7|nr:PepSY domain-containing protein [Colwellia sp. 75C3]